MRFSLFKPVPVSGSTTLVRRRPSLDFSVTGLVYCSMMMFMGLAAINSQANLLFGVFGLMIGILLMSGVLSRVVIRRLRIHRVLPPEGVVGEPIIASYEITNTKRFWPSLSICLAELDGVEGFTRQPQSYMLHAAPKMTASVPMALVPKRRGLHEFDHYQVSTSFPFGFIKRAIIDHHKDKLLIFPALAKVDNRLLAMCRSADNTGDSMRPRPGGADEFYGVRQYRAGDNPRNIYWRRSARTGILVSKEMTQVAPPRLLVVVDTFLADRSAGQHARVERAIAMAGSLASSALEQGLSVGLCAWSDEPLVIPPTRGKQQREDILTALACLTLNTAHDIRELLEESRAVLKSGTTTVLFTARDVQPSLAEQARGATVVVSPGSDAADAWFRFDPAVDFLTCMPADQQPRMEKRRENRSRKIEDGS